MSSKLFHIVRDEMALCYEISSGVRKYDDAGAFTVNAGVDDKKLAKALDVILGILKSMKSEAVSSEELRRAKEYYRGQLLFALEDTMSLMLWLGEKAIAGEKNINVKKIIDRIEKVTPEDLIKVSNNIFKDENMNLAVIGPIKDEKPIREVLRIS
jgi:predicted Zn-dependent peptidase